VYPLVEESEKLDLLNATQMAEHIQTSVFPNFRVGLIHGRMKQDEKDSVMDEFRSGAIRALSTASASRPGRTRGRPVLLHPDRRRQAEFRSTRAPGDNGRNQRR